MLMCLPAELVHLSPGLHCQGLHGNKQVETLTYPIEQPQILVLCVMSHFHMQVSFHPQPVCPSQLYVHFDILLALTDT